MTDIATLIDVFTLAKKLSDRQAKTVVPQPNTPSKPQPKATPRGSVAFSPDFTQEPMPETPPSMVPLGGGMAIPSQWMSNAPNAFIGQGQRAVDSKQAIAEGKARDRVAARANVPQYQRSEMNLIEPLIAGLIGAFDPTGQFATSYTGTRRNIMDQRDQIAYQNKMAEYQKRVEMADMDANDAFNAYKMGEDRLRSLQRAMGEGQDRLSKFRMNEADNAVKMAIEGERTRRALVGRQIANEPKLKELAMKHGVTKVQNWVEEAEALYGGLKDTNPTEYTAKVFEYIDAQSGVGQSRAKKRELDLRAQELKNRKTYQDTSLKIRQILANSTSAKSAADIKRIEAATAKLVQETQLLKDGGVDGNVTGAEKNSGLRLTGDFLREAAASAQKEINDILGGLVDGMDPESPNPNERKAAANRVAELKAEISENGKTIKLITKKLIAQVESQKKAPAGQNPANGYRDSASVDKRRQLTRLKAGAFSEFGEFKVEQWNDRDVRGKPGVKSMHAGGRAMDWYGTPEKMSAKVEWLLRQPETGYVIYNKQQWRRTRDGGWVKSKYNGVHGHEDHIHVEPRR
jgi:hypothetical protein